MHCITCEKINIVLLWLKEKEREKKERSMAAVYNVEKSSFYEVSFFMCQFDPVNT